MINIKSKKCQHLGCDKQPSFSINRDTNATHCKTHASNKMINVLHIRCAVLECQKHPNFGIEYQRPTHCKSHSSGMMYNVSKKVCITCNTTTANRKYIPNCARCHYYLNPDDPRITNYKKKEHTFMMPLKDVYPTIILDKIIVGGCSKKRPDGLIDCGTHSIIIEIDEDQHISYNKMCDNNRTMTLFNDLGCRPLIIIKMNPDSYTIDHKYTKSIFSLSKAGELATNKKEFNKRYETLLMAIHDAHTIPTKELTDIKLYYSD
jgi:hypothetical protein